jgi:pSer/pThr/pTyr-binding forkhead associated (FHA) protein
MPATPALGDPTGDGPRDDLVDLEETRIVRGTKAGERFVLQFSTGENAIVFGSGLIGRNPALEPGELVDQLIAIVDGGKTVSKTHLEFGQVEGRFWVSDRFSANGTIVRQPDTRPQRLEPGRRLQVARGTRIDMGEQFVVVS